MKRIGIGVLIALVGLTTRPAAADGLEATITDTLDFEMRVAELTLTVRRGAGGEAGAALDHIPLMAEGKRVNLWLAQIDTAAFTAKGGGAVQVDATLQGEEGDEVSGVLSDAARYFFAAKAAEGDGKGRVVRFPLGEVKRLVVHTEYTGGRPDQIGVIPPMPEPDEDVLWISSVPLGADVYAKPFDCKAALVWRDYVRIGRTPFVRELGPGTYAIKVHVPDELAQTLRPATKLGEDAIAFERDGWGEVTFRKNENVVASVTYTVEKNEGKAATLIALFQLKDQMLDEVIETFPEGDSFRVDEQAVTKALGHQQVPRADIARILSALRRGGKIIWHGETTSLLIELTPGPKGFRIGGAMRPKNR